MIHYAQTGSPVTGAMYRKRPFGPTCVPLLPTLREMESEGTLEINDTIFHGLRKKEYIAHSEPTQGVLNDEELTLLNDVIEFVCDRNSARSISEFSHKLPWEMAEFGGEIPYSSALLLFPSQATPEAFDAVEQEANEVEAERSKRDSVVLTTFADFRSRVLSQVGAD